MTANHSNWRQAVGRLLSLGLDREHVSIGEKGFQQEALLRRMRKSGEEHRPDLQTPLSDITFVILDTETTGFRPDHGDEIISVAAAKMVKDTMEDDVFSSFVRPGVSIPHSVTQLTGIRDEDVRSAPPLNDVIGDLLYYLDNAVVTGYHIGHDLSFLNHYLWKTGRTKLQHRVIEMRRILETLWDRSFPRMDDAVRYFSIPVEGRHAALEDVRMMTRVWQHVWRACEKRNIRTLYDLYLHF